MRKQKRPQKKERVETQGLPLLGPFNNHTMVVEYDPGDGRPKRRKFQHVDRSKYNGDGTLRKK